MRAKTQKDDWRESPVAWFCLLEKSRMAGDFEKAAEAKRELQRLGVDVRYLPEREVPCAR